jgi:hypothetical protein
MGTRLTQKEIDELMAKKDLPKGLKDDLAKKKNKMQTNKPFNK